MKKQFLATIYFILLLFIASALFCFFKNIEVSKWFGVVSLFVGPMAISFFIGCWCGRKFENGEIGE